MLHLKTVLSIVSVPKCQVTIVAVIIQRSGKVETKMGGAPQEIILQPQISLTLQEDISSLKQTKMNYEKE